METLTGAALVTAAQAGDRRALNALLAEHLPLVYAVVGRALGGGSDVDDVVQEAMLKAILHLGSLRDPERFRAWLVSIALRQIQDRARQRGRLSDVIHTHAAPLETAAEVADPAADFVEATHQRMQLAEHRNEILRASLWLSPADRRVLALWWQEVAGALTRAEVAEALRLSQPHTAVRVQRMKAHLDLARTLLLAWRSSPRCPELTRAAKGWDRSFHPRWINRLARHVQDCDRCTVASRYRAPTESLLIGAGHMAPPADLVALIPGLSAAAAMGTGTAAHGGWLTTSVPAPLVVLVRRIVESINLKGGAAIGAGAASVTAVVALAVYYPQPSQSTFGPPPAPTTAVETTTAPASAPSPSELPSGPPPAAAPIDPSPEGLSAADIYVAPQGSDANPGTLDLPLATIGAAVAVVRPGQTIAVRAGIYEPVNAIRIATSGAPGARIVLSNYRGERPIIDARRTPPGWFVTHTASYWTVQGLDFRNSPGHGYVCQACQHTVFRRLSIHDSGNTGLMLRDAGTVGNVVADSDFFRNHDTVDNGGTADGLSIKNGAGAGNIVRNCRLYENSGDGLDLSAFTDPVTVTGVWAYGNGVNRWSIPNFTGPGNGIKLGGGAPAPAVDHAVTNSAAWDNAGYGFTEASNRGRLVLTNNTAYRNGGTGFALAYSESFMRRNLALANGSDIWLGDGVDDQDNSWNQSGWATTVLRSGDPDTAQAARGADWSLPITTFLLNRKDATMGASMRGSN